MNRFCHCSHLLLKLRSPRDYVGSSVRACGTSLVHWMALQCANRTASRLAKRIVYEIRLIAIREVSPPFGEEHCSLEQDIYFPGNTHLLILRKCYAVHINASSL